MRGQFALRTTGNWLSAVTQMVDIQGVKVKEGTVACYRAGYMLPHPDSLTTIESQSTLAYFLLHAIRSHSSLVSLIKATITSTNPPASDGRYCCHLHTIKTWKNIYNINPRIIPSPEVEKLRDILNWDPPPSNDNTVVAWEGEECE
jgi:hypothetical protein